MSNTFTVTKHKAEVKTIDWIDKIYFALVILLFLFVADAYAYIDPGTGSYILQLTIAGLLGAAYVLKVYWRKALDFLRNVLLKSKKEEH